MKLYKITDKDGKTRTGCDNECQWGEGVTHKATGKGRELCTSDYIHAYTHPLLAVFLNPVGGRYDNKTMLIWEAEGRVGDKDRDKVGCKSLTTIKQIKKPTITTEQRCIIAIKLALKVYKDKEFEKWAKGWLENKNRDQAAEAAAQADWAAEAAWTAWTAQAAWVAAWAAQAAAWAAQAAWADWAAEAAAQAAEAAARAAAQAADVDILTIIKEVTMEK